VRDQQKKTERDLSEEGIEPNALRGSGRETSAIRAATRGIGGAMKGADAPYLAERLLPREELMRVEHSRPRGERRRRRARRGAAEGTRERRRSVCACVGVGFWPLRTSATRAWLSRGVVGVKKETGAEPCARGGHDRKPTGVVPRHSHVAAHRVGLQASATKNTNTT
jgi:hypothetical protein